MVNFNVICTFLLLGVFGAKLFALDMRTLDDEFHEFLLVKPLPDGNIAHHFEFVFRSNANLQQKCILHTKFHNTVTCLKLTIFWLYCISKPFSSVPESYWPINSSVSASRVGVLYNHWAMVSRSLGQYRWTPHCRICGMYC